MLIRAVGLACSALLLATAALFALAFYDRDWLWRDCFNELGRCYDSESQEVVLEQAGVASGGLAVMFLILGLARAP